ncbi:MAG: sigma-70 family RNA polymerase sigma factor [Actinomycetia bacterium]|nr:sigma-70 family RNA polymerase sigma factor [Actinomycetes bacterium]
MPDEEGEGAMRGKEGGVTDGAFLDPSVLARHIRKAQRNKDTAFEALYSYAWPHVNALARNLLHNDEDAADITQEVFLTMFRKIETIKSPEAGIAWLDRLTVNTVHNAQQSHCLHDDATSLDNLAACAEHGSAVADRDLGAALESRDQESLPSWRMELDERDAMIVDLVRGLPDRLSEVLVLRYWGEYRNNEIAELLGESENAVTTRLSRGRKELQTRLMASTKAGEGLGFRMLATMGIADALQHAGTCVVPASPPREALWKVAARGLTATGAKTSAPAGAKVLLVGAAAALSISAAGVAITAQRAQASPAAATQKIAYLTPPPRFLSNLS